MLFMQAIMTFIIVLWLFYVYNNEENYPFYGQKDHRRNMILILFGFLIVHIIQIIFLSPLYITDLEKDFKSDDNFISEANTTFIKENSDELVLLVDKD